MDDRCGECPRNDLPKSAHQKRGDQRDNQSLDRVDGVKALLKKGNGLIENIVHYTSPELSFRHARCHIRVTVF